MSEIKEHGYQENENGVEEYDVETYLREAGVKQIKNEEVER